MNQHLESSYSSVNKYPCDKIDFQDHVGADLHEIKAGYSLKQVLCKS